MIQHAVSYTKNANSQSPIKIAFQANIFKYTERKKKQSSIFSFVSRKYSPDDERINSTYSNLINKNTLPLNNINFDDISVFTNAKINLNQSDKKILAKKKKGYKSSLSDWRNLYQQRDEVNQNGRMKRLHHSQMAATDRLFYPSKKQKKCLKFRVQQNLRKEGAQDQSKSQIYFNTIKSFNKKARQKYFGINQNFPQMKQKSYSPILNNYQQKIRTTNYQKPDKQRKQSYSGIRLMNEGIFCQDTFNDTTFVPYNNSKHKQCNIKSYRKIQQKNNSLTYENFNISNGSITNRKIISFSQITKNALMDQIQQSGKSPLQQNSESPQYLNSVVNNFQIPNNPSQTFLVKLDQKIVKNQIQSKIKSNIFQTRKNRAEKQIFGVKKNFIKQSRFANFQYSPTKPRFNSNFSNWTSIKKKL